MHGSIEKEKIKRNNKFSWEEYEDIMEREQRKERQKELRRQRRSQEEEEDDDDL